MGIRTKIVATLGAERQICDPSGVESKTVVTYDQMIPWFVEAGVDVFRLNMSHRSPTGDQERKFLDAYRNARPLWESQGRHVAILGDLQGPEIRIGYFHDNPRKTVELKVCDEFVLHTKKRVTGDEGKTSVFYGEDPFEEMIEQVRVQKGDRIWLGDGEVLLEVQKVSPQNGTIRCHVLQSVGEIKGRRGVTVEGKPFHLESFTKKDEEDLRLLLTFGIYLTYIAPSFVKSAEDILKVRCFIEEEFRKQRIVGRVKDIPIRMPGLIAKIETQEAVDKIDEILDVADGIMVARGDLGMQVGLHKVPGIQKHLIHKCNVRGKPVITATQMLETMKDNFVPTRAEVTDVYNAIFDGTDAVMLSGETAEGKYPIQAIRKMREIAEEAERDFFAITDLETRFLEILREAEEILPNATRRVRRGTRTRMSPDPCYRRIYRRILNLLKKQRETDRIAHAACNLSVGVTVAAIIAPTTSGQTTRMVARFHPKAHIIGAAHDDCAARKLTLCFGVHPVDITEEYRRGQRYETNEQVFEIACKKAVEIVQPPLPSEEMQDKEGQPLIQKGDLVVITAGFPLFKPGTTNLVKLHRVEDC
jgi:pyruvate kinase